MTKTRRRWSGKRSAACTHLAHENAGADSAPILTRVAPLLSRSCSSNCKTRCLISSRVWHTDSIPLAFGVWQPPMVAPETRNVGAFIKSLYVAQKRENEVGVTVGHSGSGPHIVVALFVTGLLDIRQLLAIGRSSSNRRVHPQSVVDSVRDLPIRDAFGLVLDALVISPGQFFGYSSGRRTKPGSRRSASKSPLVRKANDHSAK